MTFLEKIADIRRRAAFRFDSRNPHFNNSYLSLDGTLEALQPLLEEHGLLLTQCGSLAHGVFTIETTVQEVGGPIRDEQGRATAPYFMTSSWPVDSTGGPQKMAAASTYARRYSLLALFATCAEDDDGNLAQGLSATKAAAGGGKSFASKMIKRQ